MKLGEAANINDKLADEGHSLPKIAAQLGIDMADYQHVADQRALRAVIFESRGEAALNATLAEGGVMLTASEQAKLTYYAAFYLDGIALGFRAGKEVDG
jgi:hypothetical protein